MKKIALNNTNQCPTSDKFVIEDFLAAIKNSTIDKLDVIDLYESFKVTANNEKLTKVFGNLIEEEKEHIIKLQNLLREHNPKQKESSEECEKHILKEMSRRGLIKEGVKLIYLASKKSKKEVSPFARNFDYGTRGKKLKLIEKENKETKAKMNTLNYVRDRMMLYKNSTLYILSLYNRLNKLTLPQYRLHILSLMKGIVKQPLIKKADIGRESIDTLLVRCPSMLDWELKELSQRSIFLSNFANDILQYKVELRNKTSLELLSILESEDIEQAHKFLGKDWEKITAGDSGILDKIFEICTTLFHEKLLIMSDEDFANTYNMVFSGKRSSLKKLVQQEKEKRDKQVSNKKAELNNNALQKQIVIVVDEEDFDKLMEGQENQQDKLLDKLQEYENKLGYERYKSQYGNIINDLITLANSLDNKKLFKLADEVDKIANEIVMGDSPIETILLGYQKIHQVAQLEELVDMNEVAQKVAEMIENDEPIEKISSIFNEEVRSLSPGEIEDVKIIIKKDYNWDYDALLKKANKVKGFVVKRKGTFDKIATIRTDKADPCPFGLPITTGCKYAGDSAFYMTPCSDVDECMRDNKIIYNEDRTGGQCPYADNLLEERDSVNCNYGTTTEGKKVPRLYRASPIYPKLFTGFNSVSLSRQYHQYHDFSFMSIYGGDTVHLRKTGSKEKRSSHQYQDLKDRKKSQEGTNEISQ